MANELYESLPTLDNDMRIISALDDEPNDVGGMTADELKSKFDEGGVTIKEYLNDVLLPALEELGVLTILRTDIRTMKYIRLNEDGKIEVSMDGQLWEATGSSGHMICDATGRVLPQRSRMKFAEGTVEDDGTYTIIHGVRGEKGDTGEKGETGGIGKTGPSIVPSVDEYGVMSFSVQDSATAPQSVSVRGPQGPQGVQGMQGAQGERGPQGIQGVQGIQGPKGEAGEQGAVGPAGPQGSSGPQGIQGERGPAGPAGKDGTSLYIEDIYDTLPALKLAIPGGDNNMYYVRSNGECYIYSEIESDWVSVGALQGPAGPAGPRGEQGPTGPQGVQGIRGPQGADGPQGVQGPQGAVGPEGPQGPAGASGQNGKSAYTSAVEGGYTGTETAFNDGLAKTPAHIVDQNNPHKVTAEQVGARPDDWTPSKEDVGLGNVANERQYSANNPPPYPVNSVNGKTGDVNLTIPDAYTDSQAQSAARTVMNRSNNVNVANTSYSTYMARGEALFNSETKPTVNGTIAWKYE